MKRFLKHLIVSARLRASAQPFSIFRRFSYYLSVQVESVG